MEWKGGVALSYSNQSYLRFSLEESIWFQTGQEVAELVSISLDPSITIQESDQYVTIKGSLELSGEYNRDDHELEEELDSFSNPKFVQSVEVRGEGVYLFSHHFPVEITIPKNRIENVFDIDVAVETFDYAFPERSCLKLSADLMITGLYGELQHERLHEQDEIDEIEEDAEIDEIEEIEEREVEPPVFYTPFEIEVRKEPVTEPIHNESDPKRDDPFAQFRNEEVNSEDHVDEEEVKHEQAYTDANRLETKNTVEDLDPIEIEVEVEPERKAFSEDHVDEEEVKHEQAYTDANRLETENTVEDLDPIEIEVEVEPEKKAFPEIIFSAHRNEEQQPSVPVEEVMDETEEVTENDVIPEEEETEELNDELEENESTTPKNKKGKEKGNKWKNKQSLTLSEFFARKAEETHTKLTVVIVQNGDSLNSLSERYEVPVSQLQKVNQIELNQDISEGQVLYIPIAQTQR
jgi:stage VI sporulation protein D